MTEQPDPRPWWRRLLRPRPDLKIDELEAKLRKAERDRENEQGGANR